MKSKLSRIGEARNSRRGHIFIVRHAEPSEWIRRGTTCGLSPFGEARARALIRLFTSVELGGGRIDALIAADDARKCCCPTETLGPLAACFGLPISAVSSRDPQAAASLATKHAREQQLNALICWRPATLPRLLHCLDVPPALVPKRWPANVYDLFYIVQLSPYSVSLQGMQFTYAGAKANARHGAHSVVAA